MQIRRKHYAVFSFREPEPTIRILACEIADITLITQVFR